MGKLKKFFGIDNYINNNYGEDENGERLYYPWGKPGEAYYLTLKQEVIIGVVDFACQFLLFFGAFYLVFYLCFFCRDSNDYTSVIFIVITVLGISCKYLEIFYIHAKHKAYVLPVGGRPERKINKFEVGFLILSAILFSGFAVFYIKRYPDELVIFSFIMFASFVMIGWICSTYILKKTKGYIFNK